MTDFLVIAADGHTRSFYCRFRAAEYAQKVQGVVVS